MNYHEMKCNRMAFLTHIFPLSSHHLQELEETVRTSDTAHTVKEVVELLAQEECDKLVIVGPDRVDKTSLVFQAAVSEASSGAKVTYICTHPLKSLPTQIHGMVVPEPGVMKNVDFLYLEDTNELIKWCASVHTRVKFPSVIIIEDILAYATQICDRTMERSLARLCATIADAAAWIATKNDLKRCQILMTAPARITSYTAILSQFNFKTASYEGPSKDDPNSQLSYKMDNASINIRFGHLKNQIIIHTVQASKTTAN